MAETVRLAGEAGLSRCSIEDIDLPGADACGFEEAVARVRAAALAARGLPGDLVLVARADGVMTGAYGMDEALRRVRAFDAAGADCLYVPILPDLAALGAVCQATSKPVNALAAGPFAGLQLGDFAAAGAARVSLGSSLARVAHAAIIEAAGAVVAGDFTPFRGAARGAEVDALLARGAG